MYFSFCFSSLLIHVYLKIQVPGDCWQLWLSDIHLTFYIISLTTPQIFTLLVGGRRFRAVYTVCFRPHCMWSLLLVLHLEKDLHFGNCQTCGPKHLQNAHATQTQMYPGVHASCYHICVKDFIPLLFLRCSMYLCSVLRQGSKLKY